MSGSVWSCLVVRVRQVWCKTKLIWLDLIWWNVNSGECLTAVGQLIIKLTAVVPRDAVQEYLNTQSGVKLSCKLNWHKNWTYSCTSQYNIFSVPLTHCILGNFACYFCRSLNLLFKSTCAYLEGREGRLGVWIAWKIMQSSTRQPNPLFYPREHLHATDAFSRRHVQMQFFVAGEGLVPCMFLSDDRRQDKVIHIWAATCDFQQCGILTGVDSDEPVQPPFKDRNSKCC